jgi:hypothetical protein
LTGEKLVEEEVDKPTWPSSSGSVNFASRSFVRFGRKQIPYTEGKGGRGCRGGLIAIGIEIGLAIDSKIR